MENKTPRQRLAAFMPICMTAVLANAAYIGIIYYLEQNGGIGAQSANPDMQTYIFKAAVILSVAMIAIVPFIFKRFVNSYKPKPNDTGDYFTKYISCWIVFMVTADAVAIFGIIIYFSGGDAQRAYTCIALSTLVLILNLPKRAHLEKLQQIEKDVKFQQELFKDV
ncbi:MAG: hypothetical protein LBF71_03525 [Campylobacteraceae bacterium]|jgi:hypothetical protein|nr:hypothetical protein [Campylobacteraceae bacterium]